MAVGAFVLSGHVDPTFAYYATPTRAGEILVGSALAAFLEVRAIARVVRRIAISPVGWIQGGLALGALLAIWSHAELSSPSLFPWIAAANAGATALVVVELVYGVGIRRCFAIRAFTSLGRVSYGVTSCIGRCTSRSSPSSTANRRGCCSPPC
ncbi:MAG: hypothetical protein R2715_19420 [Ilumatobacteraceae bacterium]